MAIAKEKSIVGTLRLVLANIITAGQVVIVGGMMIGIANVIITGWCPELQLSDFACRLMLWVMASGGTARLMYMTTFTITVYVLVRYGARKMKIWVAVVAVVGVWIGSLLSNTIIFSPDIMQITSRDNRSCIPRGTGYKTFIRTFVFNAAYVLLGFAVSVFSPIATIWYIRHNTVSGDITLVKAMVKFTIFLILGNVINFFGHIVPLTLATFALDGMNSHTLEKAFSYTQGVLILISLIPTPVLILIYFRPVRQRMKRMLCCVCMKKVDMSEKNKTGTTAIGSGGKANSADAGINL